jgi:integrase
VSPHHVNDHARGRRLETVGDDTRYRITLPRLEHKEKRFLTAFEVEALAEAMDERYRAFVYAGAYLGCRYAELAGLKGRHLHTLKRQVAIVGSLERVRGTFRYVEELKSSSARRTLPVPAFLVEILGEHLARAPESEWIFPAPSGGMLHYSGFRRRFWNPAVVRADLGPVTPHELRHTFVALSIAQGADQLTIQRRLGHKDISTTLNVYGHLFPDRDVILTDRMDAAYRGAKRDRLAAYPRPGSEKDVVDLPVAEAEKAL